MKKKVRHVHERQSDRLSYILWFTKYGPTPGNYTEPNKSGLYDQSVYVFDQNKHPLNYFTCI